MKPIRRFFADARRQRGLALIIVLSMLALATIVILAFLSVADTEYKATNTYSASQAARRHADSALNIVISQIRAGSEQDGAIAGREFHATQPGAVRKYTQHGSFLAGYKLFSDEAMIVKYTGGAAGNASITQERNFVANSEPVQGWNTGNNLARYVDMNDPVVKGVADASGDTRSTLVYFPIIDPRAAYDIDPGTGAPIPVEGFSYSETVALRAADNNLANPAAGSSTRPIVVPTAGVNPDQLRLAMPVRWLYVLKDGSIGYLDNNLTFRGGATEATETNPIVARIAFWTDDETCKINVNTAAEPTFIGQPLYYHERDHRWADYPAARSEYQRFPGHPATVALSSVFYPNPFQSTDRSLDTYAQTGSELNRMLSIKERIYDIIPRIHTGGSRAGTRLFAVDDFNSGETLREVEVVQAANERLYASVEELIFSQQSSNNRRILNDTAVQSGVLFNKQTLERASAFLTAHSRGSEINILGLPKIAMWPVAESQDRRTGFDNLIEFCSMVGPASNSYVFRRGGPMGGGRVAARDAYYDINLPRNKALMEMLDKVLANAIFPAATESGGNGATFKAKMRSADGYENYRQVLVQMFDYIRSTNLHDGYLVPAQRNSWPSGPNNAWGQDGGASQTLYHVRDALEAQGTFKTYTPGIVRNTSAINNPFNDIALPGHGQVTPAAWTIGGKTYKGFGRMVSISEIGLHMICTADGQPDMYSWRIPEPVAPQPGDPNPTIRRFRIPDVGMQPFDNKGNITSQVPSTSLESLVPEPIWVVSGGRTALQVVDTDQDFLIEHDYPRGFTGEEAFLVNTTDPNIRWNDGTRGADPKMIKRRYYSNYPPLSNIDVADALYGTVHRKDLSYERFRLHHPGTDWENWNWTLEKDTPLAVDEKRIQAMLHFEFFCPSVGYTKLVPDFTIVLDGTQLASIEVDGKAIFNTTRSVVLKSGAPLFAPDATPETGGFASFRKIANGRFVGGADGMPEDTGFKSNATGDVHDGLFNMELVSSFFTVKSDAPLNFSSGVIRANVYDSHDWQGRDPIQTIEFELKGGRCPTPDLVVRPSHREFWVRDSDGATFNHPTVQAPRWWAFHRGGALGRQDDTGNQIDVNSGAQAVRYQARRGRLLTVPGLVNLSGATAARGTGVRRQSLPGASSLLYGFEQTDNYKDVRVHEITTDTANMRNSRIAYDPETNYNMPLAHFGTDVMRSLQPGSGDARMIAAKRFVQASDWKPHVLWDNTRAFLAHNFSSYNSDDEAGFDRRGDTESTGNQNMKRILPDFVTVGNAQTPDAPFNGKASDTSVVSAARLAQRYYDFDDSDPGGRVGPFINKPDEGNFSVGEFKDSAWPTAVTWRSTYFRTGIATARFAAGSRSFFSPNRTISSPVMMGSLPSRVFFSNPNGIEPNAGGNGSWTNLLFRPHVQIGGNGTSGASAATHPGQSTPPDHYLLDLFWMPVVEPYAISEPLSTAGKVNMNYQMVPFTHIRRATALHAVMKGEMMATLPKEDHTAARGMRTGFTNQGKGAPVFHSEGGNNKYWHHYIAIDRFNDPNGSADQPWYSTPAGQRVQATLRQFEERFNFTDAVSNTGPSGIGGTQVSFGSFRQGLFRSATQICEVHLLPSRVKGASTNNVNVNQVQSFNARRDAMAAFWQNHAGTGDNTRERPYSNLYAKLTTRSNTFRVHVRAQTLKKVTRGENNIAARIDLNRDQVSSEFRGSFLIERYIDRSDLISAGNKADFTQGDPLDMSSHPPLDTYYRFRVLESKKFAP